MKNLIQYLALCLPNVMVLSTQSSAQYVNEKGTTLYVNEKPVHEDTNCVFRMEFGLGFLTSSNTINFSGLSSPDPAYTFCLALSKKNLVIALRYQEQSESESWSRTGYFGGSSHYSISPVRSFEEWALLSGYRLFPGRAVDFEVLGGIGYASYVLRGRSLSNTSGSSGDFLSGNYWEDQRFEKLSVEGPSLAFELAMDVRLSQRFSLGAKYSFSETFNDHSTSHVLLFFRLNIPTRSSETQQ